MRDRERGGCWFAINIVPGCLSWFRFQDSFKFRLKLKLEIEIGNRDISLLFFFASDVEVEKSYSTVRGIVIGGTCTWYAVHAATAECCPVVCRSTG